MFCLVDLIPASAILTTFIKVYLWGGSDNEGSAFYCSSMSTRINPSFFPYMTCTLLTATFLWLPSFLSKVSKAQVSSGLVLFLINIHVQIIYPHPHTQSATLSIVFVKSKPYEIIFVGVLKANLTVHHHSSCIVNIYSGQMQPI